MLALTVVVLLLIIVFYNDWKAFLFDQEFAFVLGIKTALLEYLLLVLVAMTVVVLIRVVGIILVLALLTAPAAAAGLLTRDLKKRMALSGGLGIVFCVAGLWMSYELNIASGAAIVTLSVLCYLIVYALSALRLKTKRRAPAPSSGHAVRTD
jgi:zinc transport system permease protein